MYDNQKSDTLGPDHMDRLIDENQAADILCYSVRALQNWRVRGGGPKFIKVSKRSIRYTRRDLQTWIDDRNPTFAAVCTNGSCAAFGYFRIAASKDFPPARKQYCASAKFS